MIPLVTLPNVVTNHEAFRKFGGPDRPLRPSRLAQFVMCPMSAFLATLDDVSDSGGKAADTGNLVHAAAAEMHRVGNDPEAGLRALDAAREKFPLGDPQEARRIFNAYAADPANAEADVVWCEHPVTLHLAPAADDPTGLPVVIEGTLDQVRRDRKTKRLSVWDIKTGSGKDAGDTILAYMFQQAAYTVAAIADLDASIECGGIIYTPGYDKPRARRHLPLNLTVQQCRLLLLNVVRSIADHRRGVPIFRPGVDACKFCPVRPYTNCLRMFQTIPGVTR